MLERMHRFGAAQIDRMAKILAGKAKAQTERGRTAPHRTVPVARSLSLSVTAELFRSGPYR